MLDTQTVKEQCCQQLEALRPDKQTWMDVWREVNEFIRPGKFRHLASEKNRGTRNDRHLINNTARRAGRTLQSGLMNGATSRATPWFLMGTADASIQDKSPVKAWLFEVQERIRDALNGSNLYNNLHDVYGYLGDFGTGVLYVEEDPVTLIRGYVFPVGQYALAASARLDVDTCYREFSMTVKQLVEKFCQRPDGTLDLSVLRPQTRELWKQKKLQTWIEVVHAIEPRTDRDPSKADPKNMPFRSVWYEKSSDPEGQVLSEKGFAECPFMAPRWDVTGEDVYGRGPGIEALGDAKALQLYELRKAELVDKISDPPLRVPRELMNKKTSLLPGKRIYVDASAQAQAVSPAMEVEPAAVTVVAAAAQEAARRIEATYYTDLWLALLNDEGPQMTAEEVRERHQEKLSQLGPVMERLETELLAPLILRVFGILYRQGALPPPPPELQGQEITLRFISIMSQATKLVASTGLQRVLAIVGNLTAQNADIVDKIDYDAAVEELADAYDLKPSLLRGEDEVQALRQQRAQAQAQQQAAQTALAATQGARNLAGADLGGDSMLSRAVGTIAATQAGGG